jgi:hypothetical protein
MIRFPSVVAILMLLVGCGGGGNSSSNPPPPAANLTGNWQAAGTSSVTSGQQTVVFGNLMQTGDQVSGMLTLSSSCFGYVQAVNFTGILQGMNLTLTSNAVNSQVLTITATTDAKGSNISGTYSVQGGCAAGDQGNFAGNKIPALDGNWTAQFAGASGLSFSLAQTTPDPKTGYYAIAGSSSSSSTPVCFAGNVTGNVAGTSLDLTVTSGDIFSQPDQIEFRGTINLAGTVMTGTYLGLSGNCVGLSGSATLTKH